LRELLESPRATLDGSSFSYLGELMETPDSHHILHISMDENDIGYLNSSLFNLEIKFIQAILFGFIIITLIYIILLDIVVGV